MEKVIYLIFGLTFFLVSVHYLTKILDWNNKRLSLKFKDNKTEFISDLYKLQEKWAKRGEFDYAQGLNVTLVHYSIPAEKEAATAYGKNVQQKLKELEDEEYEQS